MIWENQKLDIIFVHFSLSQKSLGKIKTRNYIINGFTYLKDLTVHFKIETELCVISITTIITQHGFKHGYEDIYICRW
jgi:hypothetical protein